MMRSFSLFFLGLFALESGILFLVPVHAAGSAALSITPSGGSYAAGKTFAVSVALDSGGGVGVNAADGKLSFDPTLLAVQSVSKGNSVFNLWVADPSFSNAAGSVDFSGGGTKAYTGSSGNVFDITFKALKAGTASVTFVSGSALAADGQGTDVLGAKNGAAFTLGGSGSSSPSPTPSPSPSSKSGSASSGSSDNSASAIPAPSPFVVSIAVSSPTHPDPAKWYANANPSFAWQLTSDIAGVNTAFDRNPATLPRRSSEGLISSKQYSNIAEGVWYFHIRFEDALGNWSDPVNFEIRVDLTPPQSFTVNVRTGGGLNGRALLAFSASDTVSGIDHYESMLDGGNSSTISLAEMQDGVYTAPPILPGKHTMVIKAVDKAGNFNEANAAFEIQGVAKPNITNFPATVIEKSPIVLEGIADSGSNVTVDLNEEGSNKVVSEGKMVADETGHWLYAIEGGLSNGKYVLGVSMVTVQGAFASSTAKNMMDVISAPFLERFGWIFIVILLSLIGALITFGFYKKKFIDLQLALAKRENEEARVRTKAVFEALREEIDDQVGHMEGGAAQAQGEAKLEPEHVLDTMRNALTVSENTIQKEIDDVDKALDEK